MTEQAVPGLVAHRGYLSQYPENTWMGLEAALNAGACWLEFDVQMCADGQFVLLHDDNLQRTAGVPGSVFDLGFRQLQRFSVHEPQRFDERFKPVEVCNLTTILDRLTRFPGARAMVEIKTESLQHWGLERVMDTLLSTLTPFRDQCVLISFSHAAIVHAKQHGTLDTGWVLNRYDEEHRQQAELLQPRFLICNQTKLPAQQAPWSGSWQWMLYDIVDAEQALHWGTQGVALIETADIGTMLQHPLLARRSCRHEL